MKKAWQACILFMMITSLILCCAPCIQAQDAGTLTVEQMAICRNIVDREPADAAERFDPAVGKIFCFTRITGAQSPVEITHAWYFGSAERARVNLTVRSPNYRTYSSKLIQAHETGEWHVDVLGPDGTVLKTQTFTIAQ